MKLVIDRSRWLHGEGANASYLLRETDGKMCCLGFLALQCGAVEDDIRASREPSEVSIEWPERLSEHATCLMIENDNIEDTDNEREAGLTTIFTKMGIEVEFVDGSPAP